MGNVNTQFITTTAIIILGYIIKRFNIVSEKDGEVLTKIVLNVTLPALVISSSSALELDLSLGFMPLSALFCGLLMAAFGLFLFRKQSGSSRGVLSMLLPGFSVGLFAFPFVEGIWGKKALNYAAMFDMGNSLVTFGIVYLMACYFSSEESGFDFKSVFKKISRSMPLIVYMITLAANISGLRFPDIIINISQAVSKANLPVSLLTVGIFLDFRMESSNWRNAIKVLAARYLMGLALGILQYFALPFNDIAREVILICLVLPPPMSTMAFVVHFKFDKNFVGMVMNISNIMSYLLMWVIFSVIT